MSKEVLDVQSKSPEAVMESLAARVSLVYTEAGFYEFDQEKQYWSPIYRQNIAQWLLKACSGLKFRITKEVIKKGEPQVEYEYLEPSEPSFFERIAKFISNSPDLSQPEFFKNAPVGFTCKNGFVQITDHGPVLGPKLKKNHSRIYLDCRYDEVADCPFTKDVVASYFTKDKDGDGKQRAIYEFLAYCLLGQMCFDERGTILWVTGQKRAGKTTLIKALVNTIFPAEFIASVEPQAFSDPNRKLDLVGKLINFRDEVGAKALVDVGTIKNVVSGAMTNIKQLYKDPIHAKLEAGHLFVANDLPVHADPTGALQDRTIHIQFDQQYERPSQSPKEIQGAMLNECSGILNLLLKHYYEAQAREPFEAKSVFVPLSAQKSRTEMTREANAYAEFIEDVLEFDKEARVFATDLMHQFEVWKKHTRRAQPNPNVSMLGKKILAERPDFRVGTTARAAVYGVRFKDFKVDKELS